MNTGSIITDILVGFIAILHLFFLILEMFLWTRPMGLKIFNQSLEKAKSSSVLAANQGLYNGFLSAGLIWGLLHVDSNFSAQIKLFFLACVFVAGVYGAWTVHKKIFFIQALPAMVALFLMMVF